MELQYLKKQAQKYPDTVVPLITKGVSFGSISFDPLTGFFDTSNVEGVDDDLVVRPFGRKGDNSTIRKFDTGALQFHQGMQPVEIVGPGVDGDGDGVVDEILVGELSAMHIFSTAMERPRQRGISRVSRRGRQVFNNVGCNTCHSPNINTNSRFLPIAFPEVETDPTANVFYLLDLVHSTAGFPRSGSGVSVPMYSDLKRHDMGPDLAEATGSPLASFFITPRLWGIADTSPYLHDGRALTLTEAIQMHGGEGQSAANNFAYLEVSDRLALLTFLRTLRTPRNPSNDLKPESSP